MKKAKKPWPTKEAMQQVYAMHLWGNNNCEFYSGEGSHNQEIVVPYINIVTSFLISFRTKLIVLDLGCGDFNIGKQLTSYAQKYNAIDIVKDLISYNKENYKAANLEFMCLDIAEEKLPQADCVIVRQVLQHISNAEVKKVVEKLYNYKYVILTEHLPNGSFTPNKDIISGQGIRLKKRSGINLLEKPFNLKVKDKKELLSIELENNKGVIKTFLFTMF